MGIVYSPSARAGERRLVRIAKALLKTCEKIPYHKGAVFGGKDYYMSEDYLGFERNCVNAREDTLRIK